MGTTSPRLLSPALGRMVWLSVALTLAAQIVLGYIGLAYTHSIYRSISEKQTEAMLSQFQQNLLGQLNGINNLLLLLQTPEFSSYFKNLMPLRDEATVDAAKTKLLNKLEALNMPSYRVSAVYFIGADVNQFSYRKAADAHAFEELPDLRMETLRHAKLEDVFLSDHDRFTRYSAAFLKSRMRTDNALLSPADIEALNRFIADIQGRLVIGNGNENGVFIIAVVDERLFRQALPPGGDDGSVFSVIDEDGRALWSSSKLADAAGVRDGTANKLTRSSKDLPPFRLRVTYEGARSLPYGACAGLLLRMAGVSMATLAFSLFVSMFLMRKISWPFRLISRKLKAHAAVEGNGFALRLLPENLFQRGFHSISMKNKLLLVLLVAVSIPSVADGVIYSRLLKDDVSRKMESSVEAVGDFAAVGVRIRAQSMENVLNELSVSSQLQNYLATGMPFTLGYDVNSLQLTMFPGLNDVSYFVLLDENGNCIYSSIYSNSKDIFTTDASYLRRDADLYWIADYPTVFNRKSAAVVKRMDSDTEGIAATYLLLVPKESVFADLDFGPIQATYTIKDRGGQTIYSSRTPDLVTLAYSLVHFDKPVPNTDWRIAVDFFLNDAIEKNRVIQDQYRLCMLIVLLLSIACAYVIADLLVKPIKQLKDAMIAAGAGDLSERVPYEGNNEIGDIIRSYNRMMERLEQTIGQNMSIMEENARNKIREKELLSMKTRAELLMLQAQINPHFLYNTLETINMRSMKSGNLEISAIIGVLADLFRYSVSKGSEFVALEQELTHASNYVRIQQLRFGNSFEAVFDVPEELRGTPVMKFILQPIIENAIKHGFAGWEEGGTVTVTARSRGDQIELRVTDNGVGMNRETLERLNADLEGDWEDYRGEEGGIGLRNVYYRLKLYYGDKIGMRIESGLMNGTAVCITFPLKPDLETA